jgi:acyl-CoA synthetase (AMP-forming)/AMP-acid ligase II
MFEYSRLPRFTFVEEGGEEALNLADAGRRIQGIADMVAHCYKPEEPVGLIFKSGPALVLAWLGVALSGRVPAYFNIRPPNSVMITGGSPSAGQYQPAG